MKNMRILIDACVLYPTVMREMVLGVAGAGLFTPLWSARISEEWVRATLKLGAEQESIARAELALLRSRWPDAEVRFEPAQEQGLYLPDVNDRHVLAAAIAGRADCLLTQNLRDFPTRTLSEHGILRRDPDGLLCDFFADEPALVRAVAEDVRAVAERLSGCPKELRALLKKARLPRLGKALSQSG